MLESLVAIHRRRIRGYLHFEGLIRVVPNAYLRFEGLIWTAPNIYLRFEGVPKRDTWSIERQSPLEPCRSGGVHTWPPTP